MPLHTPLTVSDFIVTNFPSENVIRCFTSINTFYWGLSTKFFNLVMVHVYNLSHSIVSQREKTYICQGLYTSWTKMPSFSYFMRWNRVRYSGSLDEKIYRRISYRLACGMFLILRRSWRKATKCMCPQGGVTWGFITYRSMQFSFVTQVYILVSPHKLFSHIIIFYYKLL